MIKREELTNPESCMSKARDDEMTFVLLGRDKAAPLAIRSWVMERIRLGKNVESDPQIQEALSCASAMDGQSPQPEDMVWITRAEMKAYSDWHQDSLTPAPACQFPACEDGSHPCAKHAQQASPGSKGEGEVEANAIPEWWPECPYPESVFPLKTEELVRLIPDPAQRTSISGYYGRLFWNIASKAIFDSWKFNRDFGQEAAPGAAPTTEKAGEA